MNKTLFTYVRKIIFVSTNRRMLSMCFLFVLYLFFGALFFTVFEQKSILENSKPLTSSMLIRKMVVLLRSHNFTDEEIEASFAREHYKWRKRPEEFQVSLLDSFGGTFMFSITMIGSDGFGNLVPTSKWGKIMTIIYLTIGYPINLTMMRLLGIQFRNSLKKVLKLGRKFNLKCMPEVFHPTWIFYYLAGVIFFVFFGIIFLFGPAAIFEKFEDWSYEEGVYFAFFSLSAIAIGDYNAGLSSKDNNEYLYSTYFFLMFFWMFFGVAYMSASINLLSYLYGVFVLDKLDGKSKNKKMARENLTEIYNSVAKIDWKLMKYCPEEFTKEKIFGDFMDLYDDNPEAIEENTLRKLYQTSEQLRLIAYNKWLRLSLPDELAYDENFMDFTRGFKEMMTDESINRILQEIQDIPRGLGKISFSQAEKPVLPIKKLEDDDVESEESIRKLESAIIPKEISGNLLRNLQEQNTNELQNIPNTKEN